MDGTLKSHFSGALQPTQNLILMALEQKALKIETYNGKKSENGTLNGQKYFKNAT